MKRLFAVIAMTQLITGCAGFFNIGEEEYGCSGLPDGVKCMSTRDVYETTNDGKLPTASGAPQSTGIPNANDGFGEINDPVINTYVAPNLPDRPIPIRTPAQVMRIWVNNWEDKVGDLMYSGHVYTEIQPRRWVVAEQPATTQTSFEPLKSTKPYSK
ncbi:TraV family lipoprotein [Photobacterium ganghwense]|uniref:TraV family lipoprotein n=1 Tax=Photobacterium ganghwense TaxID=320778 RepID=UPI001A8F2491|nr:TraV family lipoprotein [Photobacterium ganghwense]QSV17596.1 TraV family lipoprotein [Photobacterium ganghwense]